MANDSTVPAGVKVISIFYYLGMAFGALMGLLLLFGAGAVGGLLSQVPLLGALGAGLFVVAGIILLVFAALCFLIARGLWAGMPWARMLSTILAALGILYAIFGIIKGQLASNLFGLLVNLAIGGYLWFNSAVKQAFA